MEQKLVQRCETEVVANACNASYGYSQIQGTRSKKMENYGTNQSQTFYKNLDLVPWIGEYP